MKAVVKNISDKKPEVVLWERLLKKWLSKTSDKKNKSGEVWNGLVG